MMSKTLRTVVALALIAVGLVAWTVQRTVDRAQESGRSVAHTSEVLAASEAVLTTIGAADAAVGSYLTSANPQSLETLDRSDRRIDGDINRVAALTSDNPTQQARLPLLRRETTRTLAALHGLTDARRALRDPNPADIDARQTGLDATRRLMQAIRAEEDRLLSLRIDGNQATVLRLQRMSIALVVVTVGLLTWIVGLLAANTRRQRLGADTLRRTNESLEAQVDAGAANLRESNARLQSIIDSAVDGIIVIDARGQIEAFNRGAERLFGYPASEAIGRNISLLMPSPDHERHDGYLADYLDTGTARIIGIGRQVTGRRRDGTTFPLHLSVGEMTIKGERRFTGMLHDLTERMRLDAELRASEARWRSIVDCAVDGIIVIDAHGRIESFNPAAERLFGYAERDVTGRNVNMLMPSPYHDEHDMYLARHLATGVQHIIGTGREVAGLRRDGTTFPLHLAVGKMTVGGDHKFIGMLHDLTARVRIEDQLREQSALARLGEMAAVIAHEVKNPLAGVRGAVEVIGSRLPKDGKDRMMIGEIVSRIDALNGLMKDLLLFARPPQPKASPVDLHILVATTADLLVGDPSLKDVKVTIEGVAPRILADPDLLKIVFVNLLINAAHAMEGRGTIRVSLDSVANSCHIAVADEGPGIPADVRDRIFKPFFTTKTRGSGLGLPTAKRLVEAHRGDISIACPSTGGTVVTIHLPAETVSVM
jgi:PAS domain S-box-containing protein